MIDKPTAILWIICAVVIGIIIGAVGMFVYVTFTED